MRLFKIILAGIAILLTISAVSYIYFTRGLPPLDKLDDYHPNLVTKVYAADGSIIGEYFTERRIVVPFDRMPPYLVKAFIAAEDGRFYEHEGISYAGIARAMFKNVMAGKVVQGGSTITQQLAKSFFLSSERKMGRKVREAIMAFRIEKHLTKDEILTLYLNQIYFGNGAYGVQSAAETYFGKNAHELNIAESALLAALPKAPTKYSPYVNYDVAKKRQEFVLSRMAEEQFITKEEAAKIAGVKLRIMPKKAGSLWVGPYFTEHVRRYVENKYGEEALYRGGLGIYTTLNVEAQRAANVAVRDGLREYDKRRGYRGAIRRLETKDQIDAFLAEADRKFSYDPIEADQIYQGVVLGTNQKDSSLKIGVGKFRGTIASADLQWAKHFNNTKDANGGKTVEFGGLFHFGDVVEVMVSSLPANPLASNIPMKLEQPPVAQASLLAMDSETGKVSAMVGGADFTKSQFNRAVQSLRQPGSSFKPIIYTAALDKNFTPASVIIDSPLVFSEIDKDTQWRPHNYDERFNGPTTMREALAKSRNIITIKILKDIGVDYAIGYARLLGINSPLANDLSIALGSSAVTLLDMTTAFSTLDNMGTRTEPYFITKITDRDGRVLEQNEPFLKQAVSPQTAFLMTSLMQSVVDHGTGMRARALGRPAAGKTGTTNNLNDAWFIGFVPSLTAGAWLGYDDEKPLGRGETGAKAALPIWLKFMKIATANMPVRGFSVPEGIEFARVDPETGLLAGPSTEGAIFEVFKTGTAPKTVSGVKNRRSTTDFLMMDNDSRPMKTKKQVEEDTADVD